jgi:hypothetical protein
MKSASGYGIQLMVEFVKAKAEWDWNYFLFLFRFTELGNC